MPKESSQKDLKRISKILKLNLRYFFFDNFKKYSRFFLFLLRLFVHILFAAAKRSIKKKTLLNKFIVDFLNSSAFLSQPKNKHK